MRPKGHIDLMHPGWRKWSLEQFQEHFAEPKALERFASLYGISLVHALCDQYVEGCDLLPILRWLCGPPHCVDINALSAPPAGRTPLVYAVERGHIPFIAALLDCGADINAPSRLISCCEYLLPGPGQAPGLHLEHMDVAPIDAVFNTTPWERKDSTIRYLLDRGAAHVTDELTKDAREFMAYRRKTRAAVLAFLCCWRKNPLIRKCLNVNMRGMMARTIWEGRWQ